MTKFGLLLAAGALLADHAILRPDRRALPERAVPRRSPSRPGCCSISAARRCKPEAKPAIAQAAATAKARQSTKVCVVGQTDKLGDKNYNAKLAEARSQAVAGELVRAGYPAKDVIIASNPEAFGNMSFGGNDASEKDRRVTIMFR